MENFVLSRTPTGILLNIFEEEEIDSPYISKVRWIKKFKDMGLIDQERKITPKGRSIAENLIKIKEIENGK